MLSIVLASASPRRRELLTQLRIQSIIHAVAIDETPLPNESAIDYVQRIAAEKSAVCAQRYPSSLPILAADTSVVVGQNILGKPQNQAQALQMLSQLSATTHQVYTAISLRYQQQHYQALNITEVRFRAINDAEKLAYWQTGEPIDKAGGYAIQGLGCIFIEEIRGSYSSVMGLPLYETAQLLTQLFGNLFQNE
ncbi:MAG: hypothetical protein RL637_1595 [Pseudomonadota bacterium]|jgi:septum formation protein